MENQIDGRGGIDTLGRGGVIRVVRRSLIIMMYAREQSVIQKRVVKGLAQEKGNFRLERNKKQETGSKAKAWMGYDKIQGEVSRTSD